MNRVGIGSMRILTAIRDVGIQIWLPMVEGVLDTAGWLYVHFKRVYGHSSGSSPFHHKRPIPLQENSCNSLCLFHLDSALNQRVQNYYSNGAPNLLHKLPDPLPTPLCLSVYPEISILGTASGHWLPVCYFILRANSQKYSTA